MKSIIITGASRGIGRAAAIHLAADYEYMAIIGRNAYLLDEAKTEICKHGCSCDTFCGDVSDYTFILGVVDTVISVAGRIDAIINNAGIAMTELFIDTTPDKWKQLTGTNLDSVYNLCHAALPHMIHEKNGRIINISSVWGLVGASCEVAYSATKGAINSFTRALAKELAPSNISVNAIAFGAIDTSMNDNLSPDEKALLCEEIPAGRMASAQEAAECISKLLSMPAYFTGEIVKFDGGWI